MQTCLYSHLDGLHKHKKLDERKSRIESDVNTNTMTYIYTRNVLQKPHLKCHLNTRLKG